LLIVRAIDDSHAANADFFFFSVVRQPLSNISVVKR
jgi:hypothetical protein